MVEKDQEFLEYLVKSLVDSPDAVKVTRTVDEMGVLLTLDVAAPDMSVIIGRGGATAKAIRTLLRIVGLKNHARVNLKINEPAGSLRRSATREVDQAMEDLKL
ncbi:MAG: KH domain-containing protein [Parcubacteria group bacterium]|nr:KH domain-containing protein [Parcubacteria group bacterium]